MFFLLTPQVVKEVTSYTKDTTTYYSYQWDYDSSQYTKTLTNASKLTVCPSFTKHFVDNYKYEDSTYRFALNIKVDWVWGYYDVLRLENWWVGNRKWHLSWAIMAKDLWKSCRTIPLGEQLNIANDVFEPGMQYVYKTLPTSWKLTAYVSSTEELKWRELAHLYITID